jgi:endo-1,4-beta-xylanase
MRILASLLLVALPLGAQSLRQLADARGVRIGTAVSPSGLTQPAYSEVLAREFNQVEPENAMKFGPIHPAPETYAFDAADAIVRFAQEHKMAVRGHTLVWHNQNANWIKDAEKPEAILQQHINTVMGHYAGKVYAWDVVNEAFESDGSPRKSPWSVIPDYLEKAFRWAHAADPKALLFYNDYSAETINRKSDAIYAMAKDFKARGVPIDGIGLQMHVSLKSVEIDSLKANMKRLTDLGLQVQITELDVKLQDSTPESLAAQAKVYRDIVGACLANPRCTAIQLWGFTDRYSWIPRSSKGYDFALPFDREYQPKPAYQSIVEAFRSAK